MSQFTEQYLPPSAMVYHSEGIIEPEEDLISFGGELDFQTSLDSSDNVTQHLALGNLESSASTVNQNNAQGSPSNTGQLSRRVNAGPRRKFQSADHRQETAQTRKLTACVRCRMQRVRVRNFISVCQLLLIPYQCYPDPSNLKGTCLTCQKVTKPTLHKLPCLRYKLTDIRLFREGSYAAGREWSHRWSNNNMENITEWASSELKKIQVTQDYGPTSLTFTVREFVPIAGDMLDRQWSGNDPLSLFRLLPRFNDLMLYDLRFKSLILTFRTKLGTNSSKTEVSSDLYGFPTTLFSTW